MLFINNLLHHSNIMIVYYNQRAFYCVTIKCIKQIKYPNRRHRRFYSAAVAALPPSLCLRRCRCRRCFSATAATYLPLPLRHFCRASAPLLCRSAPVATAALPLTPPCRRYRRPAALPLAAAEIPPPSPLLCHRCQASAVLPPLLCLHCCRRPASLPSRCASAVSLSQPPPFCRLRQLAPP